MSGTKEISACSSMLLLPIPAIDQVCPVFSQTLHRLIHPALFLITQHWDSKKLGSCSSTQHQRPALSRPIQNRGANHLFTFTSISHPAAPHIYLAQDPSARQRPHPCLWRTCAAVSIFSVFRERARFNTWLPAWERWILNRLSLTDVVFRSAI